jgi:hypothetical protein
MAMPNKGKIMRFAVLPILVLLSACASQVMENLVGKDVAEVQLQYGPPVNVIDMPDGRKAFQWRFDSTVVMPMTTSYTGVTNGNITTGSAFTSGGGIFSTPCFYTLFAQPNKNKSYTVVGFQPPTLDCE